jgi:outer membrane protein OmpA-like peptidoglycan-associated protein
VWFPSLFQNKRRRNLQGILSASFNQTTKNLKITIMKKLFSTLMLLIVFLMNSFAQNTGSAANTSSRGFELILKAGAGKVKGGFYDPLFFNIPAAIGGGKPTIGFINPPTMKIGAMGGIDLNYYFGTHFGLSATADIFSNRYNVIEASLPPFVKANISVASQKNQVNKFAGLGPIARIPLSNKLHATLAVYGGLLFHKKNSYQAVYTATPLPAATMVQFNSTKSISAFALKGSVRLAYDLNARLGFSLGAEYIVPFFSNTQYAQSLMHASGTGYLVNLPSPFITNGNQSQFDSNYYKFKPTKTQGENAAKLKLMAVNIGIHFKFGGTCKVKTKKTKCCGTCPVYSLAVTARDKFTHEVLPYTDVAIKNNAGEIIKTATTNAYGVVVFEHIVSDNYSITGILNNVALENGSIQKNELQCDKIIQKEILYTDRNFIVKGRAFECNTDVPIPGISVILENNELAFQKSTVTDAQGNFLLKLPEIGIFFLHAKKENYLSQTEEVRSDNYNRDKTLFVKLEICAEKVDCGKAINLKNILFDLDKYVITPTAKKELNRLVGFMKDNPSVKVELGSHTDCRNTDSYNQTLSQNRANASVDYVVSQGISADRIIGKGYGESKLLNRCADGVNCPETEHAINRRTEMKVICADK